MTPSHWNPKAEAAYGAGLSVALSWLHSVDVIDLVTRYATMLGAVFGVVIGAHGIYRIIFPRPRTKRTRDTDGTDDEHGV